MPLAELAAAVREGRITSSALVAESLRRIEAGDGPVNAVVLRRDEDALADAAALDARVAAGKDPGPLAGLPLLVKDTEDCAGLPTTFGSLLRKDAAPAERDCDAVARLRAPGPWWSARPTCPSSRSKGSPRTGCSATRTTRGRWIGRPAARAEGAEPRWRWASPRSPPGPTAVGPSGSPRRSAGWSG